MLVWDDQQAISWFVGILEGEGSFRRESETKTRVTIPNTDLDILSTCEKFLTNNRILFAKYPQDNGGNKQLYVINVSCQDSINLYNKIQHVMECRLDEYQRIMRASETTRSPSVDLYWMVGIFEAEGSFSLTENNQGRIVPRIQFKNTSAKIISKVVWNLHKMGLSWYVYDYKPESAKPFTQITIQGVLRCKRFIEAFGELWRSKRNIQRTSIVSRYCLDRLSKPMNEKYSLEELQMVNQMRQLNR